MNHLLSASSVLKIVLCAVLLVSPLLFGAITARLPPIPVVIAATPGVSSREQDAAEQAIAAIFPGCFSVRALSESVALVSSLDPPSKRHLPLLVDTIHDRLRALLPGIPPADLIILLCSYEISQDQSMPIVGHASPATGTAVISAGLLKQMSTDGAENALLSRRLAISVPHELGHLVGFDHSLDRSLMRHFPHGVDVLETSGALSWQDQQELPLRLLAARIHDWLPIQSMVALRIIFALLLAPALGAFAWLSLPLAASLVRRRPEHFFRVWVISVALGLAFLYHTNYICALLSPLIATISFSVSRKRRGPRVMPMALPLGILLAVLLSNALFWGRSLTIDARYLAPTTMGNVIAGMIIGISWGHIPGVGGFSAFLRALPVAGAIFATAAWFLTPAYGVVLSVLFFTGHALRCMTMACRSSSGADSDPG